MDSNSSDIMARTAAKYADILPLSRPEPSFKHPRMPLAKRAKIFSPFAALRGYGEEIQEEIRKQCLVPKRLLSDEETERISSLLSRLQRNMRISLTYFSPESCGPDQESSGTYKNLSAAVRKVDPVRRILSLSEHGTCTDIPFDCISQIQIHPRLKEQ